MKKRGLFLTFVVFIAILSFNASASHIYDWNRTIGGDSADIAWGIATDSSGNIFTAGLTYSFGVSNSDVWLVKYSPSGTALWNATIGGAGDEYAYDVAVDSSGNAYLAAYTDSFGPGAGDMWVIKYNSAGVYQWNKTFGVSGEGDYGRGIAVDASSNVYITGSTSIISPETESVWIIKLDSDGNEIWNRTYGNASQGRAIALDQSGNIYVAGVVDIGYTDIIVVKYNSSGSYVWNKSFGTYEQGDFTNGIAVDSSGNIYIAGDTASFNVSDHSEVWTIKLDSDGNHLWNKTVFNISGEDNGIAVDSSGVYVTGHKTVGEDNDDIWVIKYDSNGNNIWNKTIGGANIDRDTGITADFSSNIIFTSYTSSFGAGVYDIWTVKYSNAAPDTSSFGSGSTDFNLVPDITAVSNMILMNANGRIHWNNPVDASFENYSDYVLIQPGFVSLDTNNLDPTIDTAAVVNISGINCANFNLYYATGVHNSLEALVAAGSVVATEANIGGDCTDAGICTDISCTGTNLVFTAEHFDSFGAQEDNPPAAPEFSLITMLAALTVVIAGFFFVRKN